MSEEKSYEEAPEADLQATRQKLDNRLKSTFEATFEKYGKGFTGVGDEIDLQTGEIIVDNGHVAEMHAETDGGHLPRSLSMHSFYWEKCRITTIWMKPMKIQTRTIMSAEGKCDGPSPKDQSVYETLARKRTRTSMMGIPAS